MLYLNTNDILDIGINWANTIDTMETTVKTLAQNDFAQPVKPYLRYRELINRIIAMPAFVGGDIDVAGIKWIASFPKNIDQNKPRAHSVVILNHASTGKPFAIINTALLSIIRTASVSGLIIKKFIEARFGNAFKVGITGFGPIGQYHARLLLEAYDELIESITVFDIRTPEKSVLEQFDSGKLNIVDSWEKAYSEADIFITCTVSGAPYIDAQPKTGSLHCNVSLRDYKTEVYKYFKDAVYVDNWEEICREKTDIENLHMEKGLQKQDTKSIVEIINDNDFENISAEYPLFFNPMGMAVFDIALGAYYIKQAKKTNSGTTLLD